MATNCPHCGRPLPRTLRITREVREQVVHLRYVKRQKQTVIAAAVGISQASVARIIAHHA